MEEQIAALKLDDRHPRRERQRHLNAGQRHLPERPVGKAYLRHNGLVGVDWFAEQRGGFHLNIPVQSSAG